MNNNFYSNNTNYFNSNFKNDNEDYLLFESFYDIENLIYGISKVSLICSKILGLKPICMLPLNSTDNNKFIKSICPNYIKTKTLLLKAFIFNFFSIICRIILINKATLLSLRVDGVLIGKYIYDSILIKYKIPTLKTLKFKYLFRVLLELTHFYMFKKILDSKPIKCIIIGDNTYRYGLLFELSKKYKIPCICPVNLNSLSMSKFTSDNHYINHCYSIEDKYISEIKDKKQALNEINDYFNKRYNGEIEQHDVLKAFKNKTKLSKDEFLDKYNLNRDKKIIVIMPHIFCDAPHGYPNTIFDDYYEWLEFTIVQLKKNKNINLLFKEHPSASLYNEENILSNILDKYEIGGHLIDKNENTSSVILHADVVVTCGGTIGLEFSCQGKPVILAAAPPYSGLGFTIDSPNKKSYKNSLQNCHNLKKLNDKQIKKALLTAYLTYCKIDKSIENIEIGSETVLLGRKYDKNLLFNEIENFQKVKIENQKIFKLLDDFISSTNRLGL